MVRGGRLSAQESSFRQILKQLIRFDTLWCGCDHRVSSDSGGIPHPSDNLKLLHNIPAYTGAIRP